MTGLLAVNGLVAGYRRDLPILHGVVCEVHKGEIVTIIGPNGAGKSTLIKAVAGLVHVLSGKVLMAGRDITGSPPHRLTSIGVACVPQTRNIFSKLSIEQNAMLAGHSLGSERQIQVETALNLFPLLARRRKERASHLSGGQRQMLAIAMAMVTGPQLVMMDEPTAGLSPKIAVEVFQAIRALAQRGTAVLLVEQNARAALEISDRAYVFAEGQNRIDGRAQDILSNPDIGRIYLGVQPC